MEQARDNVEAKAGGFSPGIAIFIYGDRAYAAAANNLAVTIRKHSPGLPIHVWAGSGMSINAGLFDGIHPMPEELYADGPGSLKVGIHDLLPEGDWLYLDADTLCLADLRPWLDRLSAHDFAMQVLGKGKAGESIAYMPWVTPETITRVTGCSADATFFGVQSSWMWMRKGSRLAADIFDAAKGITFEQSELKEPWGQDIPDEARFSAALTMLGIEPHSEPMSFYGNDGTYKGLADAARHHPLACLYGDLRQHRLVKASWMEAYDRYLRATCASMGVAMRMTVHEIMDRKYVSSVKPFPR